MSRIEDLEKLYNEIKTSKDVSALFLSRVLEEIDAECKKNGLSFFFKEDGELIVQ